MPGVLESSDDLRGQCAECWGKSVGIRRSTASLDDKGLHAPPARDVAIALVHLLSRITGCYLHAGTMKRAEVSLSLFFLAIGHAPQLMHHIATWFHIHEKEALMV